MLASVSPFATGHEITLRVESELDPKSGLRASPQPLTRRDRAPGILLTLADAQVLSATQLEQLLAASESDERRLTTRIVEAGFATEGRVTQVLSQQLSVPWVSLRHAQPSEEALSLVPRVLAEELCLIPLFLKRARPSRLLYVAIDDPTDDDALLRVSEWADLPVRTMVATPTAIRSAIRAHYARAGCSASPGE